jgi:hypothetical protein
MNQEDAAGQYTEREALASVDQAFSRPPREAWSARGAGAAAGGRVNGATKRPEGVPSPARTAEGLVYRADGLTLTIARERSRWRIAVARGDAVLGVGVANLADGKSRRELIRGLDHLAAEDEARINRLLSLLALVVESDWAAHQQELLNAARDRETEAEEQAAAESAAARQARLEEIAPVATGLLASRELLFRVGETIAALGVTGERANSELLYLAILSQLTNQPISVAVKGDSSGGKSWLVQQTLSLVPEEAHYDLTSLSERGLIYDERDYRHKTIVIYEAHGQGSDLAQYLIRSLISEGHIKHLTVEKTPHGLRSRVIDKPVPTNFVTTTTSPELHAENETRIWSILINDSPENTRAVNRLRGREAAGHSTREDTDPWQRAHEWLDLAGARDAVVPFAEILAEAIPDKPLRLRRDFSRLLQLIQVSAVLHQCQRERDGDGRVVATVADYAMIRELVVEVFDRGVRGLTEKTLDLVEALERVLDRKREKGVREAELRASYSDLIEETGCTRVQVSRWLKPAVKLGLVDNTQTQKGLPAALKLGHYQLADGDVLPTVAAVAEACGEPVEWVHPLTGARENFGAVSPVKHCNSTSELAPGLGKPPFQSTETVLKHPATVPADECTVSPPFQERFSAENGAGTPVAAGVSALPSEGPTHVFSPHPHARATEAEAAGAPDVDDEDCEWTG